MKNSGVKMGKHWHIPQFLFILLMIIAGICTVDTFVQFGIGFVHHMHDTDGYKAVLRIIATPFTNPVTALPIASIALRYVVVFILNFILPALFFVGMHFAKISYRQKHVESHSY